MDEESGNKASVKKASKSKKLAEEDLLEHQAKYHWYDFDDSRITPIYTSNIRKQFEGKESAYMLFYRRKKANGSQESVAQHQARVPDWVKTECDAENAKLAEIRQDYEKRQNKIG